MFFYFVLFILLFFIFNFKIVSKNGNIKKNKLRYSNLFSPESLSPKRSISSLDLSTSSDELYDYKQINLPLPRSRSPTRPILK